MNSLKLKKISGNHPKAKIIDSLSPFHNKTVDILIVDGLIKIGVSLPNTEA
jgi:dihydroorotase